jgi:hypothetical protein
MPTEWQKNVVLQWADEAVRAAIVGAPASAIEAAEAGETGTGSTEGESAVGDSRDAQPPSGDS